MIISCYEMVCFCCKDTKFVLLMAIKYDLFAMITRFFDNMKH